MSFLTQQHHTPQFPAQNGNNHYQNVFHGYYPSQFKQFYEERALVPRTFDQTAENYQPNNSYPQNMHQQVNHPQAGPIISDSNNSQNEYIRFDHPQVPINNFFPMTHSNPIAPAYYFYPQIDQFGQLMYPMANPAYFPKQVKKAFFK